MKALVFNLGFEQFSLLRSDAMAVPANANTR